MDLLDRSQLVFISETIFPTLIMFSFFSRVILEGPWSFLTTEISGIFLALLVGESTVEKKTSPEFTREWLIIGTGLNLKLTSNATPYSNWRVTHGLRQISFGVHYREHGHLVRDANEHGVVTLNQKGTDFLPRYWNVSTNHEHKGCCLLHKASDYRPAHLCSPTSYFFQLTVIGRLTKY